MRFRIAIMLLLASFALPARAELPYGRVISVTQETFATVSRPQVCWQTIVTAHEKAVRQEQNTPWLVRNWQPLVGAAMGAAIGYQFTLNYGPSSDGWKWPTIGGGAIAGAVAGPGFTSGAYGLGTLAYSIWPASLPLTIGFSLVGGILGKMLIDKLFPKNPALQKPQPGEYLASQEFFIETACNKPQKVSYEQSAYLVRYRYQGKTYTARVKYYPGARLALTAAGRPVYEIQKPATE